MRCDTTRCIYDRVGWIGIWSTLASLDVRHPGSTDRYTSIAPLVASFLSLSTMARWPSLQTVRDALNSAMAEEMDRDKSVFVIGEEVARYNGAYKVTKGLLDRFGEDRVIDVSRTAPAMRCERGAGGPLALIVKTGGADTPLAAPSSTCRPPSPSLDSPVSPSEPRLPD